MTDDVDVRLETRKNLSSRTTGWLVALIGFAAFLAVYLFIYHLQSQNRSAGAIGMPDMGMKDMGKFWAFPVLQASGLVAMVTAYFSVALGLQQSRRAVGWLRMDYRTIDQVHRQIALLTIVLVVVHVVATALDAMGDSWRTVLWFNGWANAKTGWPAANWAYNIGIFAFYTLLILAPTYYMRRKVGVSVWKFAHRFILVFYILSLWHALILGLDIGHYGWIQPVIWLAQIPLLWLLARRFLQLAKRSGATGRATLGRITSYLIVGASYVAMVACLVIVVTGHSNFIATV